MRSCRLIDNCLRADGDGVFGGEVAEVGVVFDEDGADGAGFGLARVNEHSKTYVGNDH